MHSHSLPQRQQGRGQQEAGGRRGRGLGTRGPGARPRRGGGGRRRVGVLVTAHAANIGTTLVFVDTASIQPPPWPWGVFYPKVYKCIEEKITSNLQVYFLSENMEIFVVKKYFLEPKIFLEV